MRSVLLMGRAFDVSVGSVRVRLVPRQKSAERTTATMAVTTTDETEAIVATTAAEAPSECI